VSDLAAELEGELDSVKEVIKKQEKQIDTLNSELNSAIKKKPSCLICLKTDMEGQLNVDDNDQDVFQLAATVPCGHLVCLSCYTELMNRLKPWESRVMCPQCRASVDSVLALYM
jgi:hypothetical protein